MAVQYSNAPGKLLKEVDSFSGSQLKKRVDLQIIFEETLNRNREKLLDEISFTSKYVQGLMRVLREGSKNPDVTSLDHVRTDLTLNLNKVIGQLREAIGEADGTTKQHFEKSYFEMTQQSFLNLNELLYDLEWTKKYFNEQKRKIKN